MQRLKYFLFIMILLHLVKIYPSDKGIEVKTVPQKVMFYSPDLKFQNTIDNTISFLISSVLKEMSQKNVIFYIHEEKYENMIFYYNINDPVKLSEFYNKTGISASIDYIIDKKEQFYRVKVIINDIVNGTTFENIFFINQDKIDKDILILKANLETFFASNLPVFSINELEKLKTKKKRLLRINDTFSIMNSFGTGIHAKGITNASPYITGIGPVLYDELFIKLQKFYLNVSLLSSIPLSKPVEDVSREMENSVDYHLFENISKTIDLRGGLTLGFLFYNEIFGFGTGGNYLFTSYYFSENNNDTKTYREVYYSLVYFYLNFIFKPYKTVFLSIDFGSYISPTDTYNITPSLFFPFYIKTTIKYIVYRNLFVELSLPFNLLNFDDGTGYPVTDFHAEIGVGWYWGWKNK